PYTLITFYVFFNVNYILGSLFLHGSLKISKSLANGFFHSSLTDLGKIVMPIMFFLEWYLLATLIYFLFLEIRNKRLDR
ncbi:MAG: hypothetical protein WCG27_11455, partial [Pseudomonadota bacterium]